MMSFGDDMLDPSNQQPNSRDPWQPINTAPKGGRNYSARWEEAPKIDILAKIWIRDGDKFEFRRFPDCRWVKADDMINRPDRWSGLDDGWLAVAWMPVPKIPESYP